MTGRKKIGKNLKISSRRRLVVWRSRFEAAAAEEG